MPIRLDEPGPDGPPVPHCGGFRRSTAGGGRIPPPRLRSHRLIVLTVASPRGSDLADLPDHAGARDLDEWAIVRAYKLAVRIGLAKVAYGPVIDEVGALVRAELNIYGAVDPVNPAHERLLERFVESEPRE